MITGDEDTAAFVGLVIGFIIGVIVTLQYNSTSETTINRAIQYCLSTNSKLELVYGDGDFECKNGSFVDRSVLYKEGKK